jgi:predicted DsbA family dithiol-disulfide isomerase
MEIKNDIEDGAAAGVSAVPALFINGRYISGTFSYEKLREMVGEELQLAHPEAAKTPAPVEPQKTGS